MEGKQTNFSVTYICQLNSIKIEKKLWDFEGVSQRGSQGSSINYVVGGGDPPHVVDYVTTTVRGGYPPPPTPHVVDYGNFFWSCFIQCWVWGGTPPITVVVTQSTTWGGSPPYFTVVDYVGGGTTQFMDDPLMFP